MSATEDVGERIRVVDVEFIRSLDRAALNRCIGEKRQQLVTMKKGDIDFAALSMEICYMWAVQRENNWDMVIDQSDYIDPRAYDVLLSDVNHNLLISEISDRLGVIYLEAPGGGSAPPSAPPQVLHGILYGANMRPMINLVISSKRYKIPRNIIFLVDTGSPHLYLCKAALEALGFLENIPTTFDILFRNIAFEASVSPEIMPDGREGHFRDVNLIGSSFLTKARAKLHMDYAHNEFSLDIGSM